MTNIHIRLPETMAATNRISLTLTPEALSEIEEAFQILNEKLAPHLIELQSSERHEMPKMGDKTVAFVTKTAEYAEQNPSLLPAYIDLDEFKKDLQTIETLRAFYTPLAQITKMLDDTMMLAGSEAYLAALGFYNGVKGAIQANIPGAALIYDDLRQRFPGRRHRQESE